MWWMRRGLLPGLRRPGAHCHEDIFDRFGRTVLEAEIILVKEHWPDADLLVSRPDQRVLAAARLNPLAVAAAMPAFIRTIRSAKHELAAPATWNLLKRHLVVPSAPLI